MFRRLASETTLSWLCVCATMTAASAVEFVVSDKSPPAVAQAPSPAYPDAGSILDELPDVDADGTGIAAPPKRGGAPADVSEPIEPYFDALPDDAGMTRLPYDDGDGSPYGTTREFNDDDFTEYVFDECGPCDACGGNACSCRRACQGWFLNTWLSQGFTWNPDKPNNNFNTPVTFNDRANEYQMNQLYLSLGRHVQETGQQWDLGARLDLLYGTDYFFTQARGLEVRDNGAPRWNSADGPRATEPRCMAWRCLNYSPSCTLRSWVASTSRQDTFTRRSVTSRSWHPKTSFTRTPTRCSMASRLRTPGC